MPVEWAGLGPELLLRLDRDRAEPLRVQLEEQLRHAIRAGRIAAGERLPSSRVLARELGVSRGLVLECYAQLESEGYLSTRGGSATRVAANAHVPRPLKSDETAPAQPARRLEIDFRPGSPDLTSFPRADWLWALREAARRAPTSAFGYGDPRGQEQLREVVAAYLRRVRGAVTDPEHIVICSGFAQGVHLVLRALKRAGLRCVGLEDPGHAETRQVSGLVGVEVAPVRVDAGGIVVDELLQTAAGAVILTPAHQTPTGVVLAPQRRHALVDWACRTDATIIEDDYDAEIRYDREPVGAMQGLASAHVALLGTVSKSLAPALRLGWIVCPPALTAEIANQKLLDDHGSPGLDQLALALLIESGRYDRHLRRIRGVYARRRLRLTRALAAYAPQVELQGLEAGFHAVLQLPDDADEQAVIAAARERGVGLYPMSAYRMSGLTTPPQLVLGFGNVSDDAVERGIARIGDLLRGS